MLYPKTKKEKKKDFAAFTSQKHQTLTTESEEEDNKTCEAAEESAFFGSAQLTVGALSPSLNFGLVIFCLEYSAHAWL